MKSPQANKGFGAIAAIMILVVLALFASAVVKFGSAQALGSAQDTAAVQAWQAARAGLEWGLYRAIRAGQPWHTTAGCDASGSAGQTFQVGGGMLVTVRCEARDYNEGEVAVAGTLQPQVTRHFIITATACSSSVACPDPVAAVTPAYAERVRQASASCSVDPVTNEC